MKRIFITLLLLSCCQLSIVNSYAQRPDPEKRSFRSESVDALIAKMESRLRAYDERLWQMFQACYPNTLDTTVRYQKDEKGDDDTFVITGDIEAMWLRDSGAQVWPYMRFLKDDAHLRHMIRGLLRRQFRYMTIDPYANAFNYAATGSQWESDMTKMQPILHERKYEIDSLCYPLRLAFEYWLLTGDDSVFDDTWLEAIRQTLKVFREQQRKGGNKTSYTFQRKTSAMHDTVANYGYGHPVRPCGLIASFFRPSDDACIMPFLVPSNFFAVSVLRKAAVILEDVNHEKALAQECRSLAEEVAVALQEYAVVNHPQFGRIYAFEVDGFGGCILQDDANAPSLLSLPYLTDVSADDPIYQNTRRMVWSEWNPYFFVGKAAQGIGSQHTGLDQIWPMSIIMKGLTTSDKNEQKACLEQLLRTDGGKGLMHESFDKDNPEKFTRSWFAWANGLFGELVLHIFE